VRVRRATALLLKWLFGNEGAAVAGVYRGEVGVVLGPFMVIADVTVVARASDMRVMLSQFTANSAWTWVTGAFVLIFGLIIIAGHQYWRGAAAIIVSLLGWLIALRGIFLLAFPKNYGSVANSMIGAQAWMVAVCIARNWSGSRDAAVAGVMFGFFVA